MYAQSNIIGYPQLSPEGTLTFRARHVYDNSQLLIDGEHVDAQLDCVEGALPNCIDERVQATLSSLPEQGDSSSCSCRIRSENSATICFSFQMSRRQRPNRETYSSKPAVSINAKAETRVGNLLN